MIYRLEIGQRLGHFSGEIIQIQNDIDNYLKISCRLLAIHQVFKIDLTQNLSEKQLDMIQCEFTDPVIERSAWKQLPVTESRYAAVVGFKPGVTDNVGRSAAVAIRDILGPLDDRPAVYSEKVYFFSGMTTDREQIATLAREILANELIQSVGVRDYQDEYMVALDTKVPRVVLGHQPAVAAIDLPDDDDGLMQLSRDRVLSLTLDEMRAIREYFSRGEVLEQRRSAGLPAQATDVELETLAQTWSEHCKHKIFNAVIDYYESPGEEPQRIDSLFKSFIKRTTRELAHRIDYLVSVFDDNAGVIRFDDTHHLVYKVETHNSPSALDPYGGAMTGIVGVNRDPAGTGMGAKLLCNVWGYCFGSPDKSSPPIGVKLPPWRIREGVHQGVIDGGNHSGIPYTRGWELFDRRFGGKPLVFCGTVGLLPVLIGGQPGEKKEIMPGDLIVMIGGRIGKDGIHGATFSSAALDETSPLQAVQIGDPITQKMMFDFLYEARDRQLYRAITDNGAGGLSSSVGEMARFSGGCRLDLARAPLKYSGLDPWEILVSEAQERMTLAVDPAKIDTLRELARRREVDLAVLGEFTQDGLFHILYAEKSVALLQMNFLHDGVPDLQLTARWHPPVTGVIPLLSSDDVRQFVLDALASHNLSSKVSAYRHYDHEVKGISVIKPFIGIQRDVPSDATVVLPEAVEVMRDQPQGIVLTEGINPWLSDYDAAEMTRWSIDLSIRRALSVGGEVDHWAGLDNFCWPDPVQSAQTPDGEWKLAQLARSNQALYEATQLLTIPLISGKDSMKNDVFWNQQKISIPPTLLFSLIGRIKNLPRLHTLQLRRPGEIVYILGTTANELGGSELMRLYQARESVPGQQALWENPPRVDMETTRRLMAVMRRVNCEISVSAAHAPGMGGLVYSLFLMMQAGQLGLSLDFDLLPVVPPTDLSIWSALFAESAGRMLVVIPAAEEEQFLNLVSDFPVARLGAVSSSSDLKLHFRGKLWQWSLTELANAWKGTHHE